MSRRYHPLVANPPTNKWGRELGNRTQETPNMRLRGSIRCKTHGKSNDMSVLGAAVIIPTAQLARPTRIESFSHQLFPASCIGAYAGYLSNLQS